MDFLKLRKLLPSVLASGVSVELVSSPGLGKSEFVEQIRSDMEKATNQKWGFAKMFLATQTPPDLIGYQFKGERDFGAGAVAVTEPTLPLWMMTTDGKPVQAYERGILFLDEYGQGEADVKRASAELLLNKQIGPWKLPPGWSVIAASNRSSDRSGVTKSFDFVINRRLEVEVSPSVDAWTEWAMEHGIAPLTVAFANQNPHIVFEGKVPDKQGPWCTPRSLVMADNILQSLRDNGEDLPDGPEAVELITGMIGAAASAQYFSFVRLEREMPKYEKIIASPDKVKVPEKPDAQMLVIYNLAHRVKVDELDAVITYIKRMPKEFSVTFARSACKLNPQLVASKAMNQWCADNASLMAAIAHH